MSSFIDSYTRPPAGGRYIVRQQSRDLIHWTPRQTVFNPMGGRWPEVESMMTFYHRGIYFRAAPDAREPAEGRS